MIRMATALVLALIITPQIQAWWFLGNTYQDLMTIATQDTGTELDSILFVVENDEGLVANTTLQDRLTARNAANFMNQIIVEALVAEGVTEIVTEEDVYYVAKYIAENHGVIWVELHGDDYDDGTETGYHLVQNDGADWNLYGQNAVDTVFDGVYHLGFAVVDADNQRVDEFTPGLYVQNEDGDRNASLADLAYWLNSLLREDLEAGTIKTRHDLLLRLQDRNFARLISLLIR